MSSTPRRASTYFYPRPPRGGRRVQLLHDAEDDEISIHALREEGDRAARSAGDTIWLFLSTPSARRATAIRNAELEVLRDFYPRPPRGGRLISGSTRGCRIRFLSTPSARRATLSADALWQQGGRFLSTPSARRATGVLCKDADFLDISIHALREEGDIWA